MAAKVNVADDEADPLFIAIWPTGIGYADRTRERDGDYVKLGFLTFSKLELRVARDCPPAMLGQIERHAGSVQARRGEPYEIDCCGHSVVLGHRL